MATVHPEPRVKRDCICKVARHVHGTNQAYLSDRCRCPECVEAHAEIQRRHRRLRASLRWNEGRDTIRVAATGTRLRLQALARVGWSLQAIADELNVSKRAVAFLRDEYQHVSTDTAARVAAVYDRLWDVQPVGHAANQVRRHAASKGWLPPLALDDDLLDSPTIEEMGHMIDESHPDVGKNQITVFIDEIAVEQAMAGRRVNLTRAEVTEAVHRLTAMGFSARQIAERVGVTDRTVTRRRAA